MSLFIQSILSSRTRLNIVFNEIYPEVSRKVFSLHSPLIPKEEGFVSFTLLGTSYPTLSVKQQLIQVSPPPMGVTAPGSGVSNPEMTTITSTSTNLNSDVTVDSRTNVQSSNMVKVGDIAKVKGAVLREWLGWLGLKNDLIC